MIHHECHEDVKLNCIFAVRIDNKTEFWFNAAKTADDFQTDMLLLIRQLKDLDPDTLDHEFRSWMRRSGYVPVEDLVSDTFIARIVHTKSRLIPEG